MGIENSISSFSASITSPAKLAFIGYVVLAYIGKIQTSRWQFIIVAVSFFLLQVFHDDYLRIRLNASAELSAKAAGYRLRNQGRIDATKGETK